LQPGHYLIRPGLIDVGNGNCISRRSKSPRHGCAQAAARSGDEDLA
jgi:hypothetical protein